jgi:hypothetical protein
MQPFCLMPSKPDKELKELSQEHKKLTKIFVDLYLEVKKEGWYKFFENATKKKQEESSDEI